MKTKIVKTVKLTPPAIGKYWVGQGGRYGGVARAEDGMPDSYLIGYEGPTKKDVTHAQAVKWVKTLKVDGHADFHLPSRIEGHVAKANLGDLFEKILHWLGEQYAGVSDYAWGQRFDDGEQTGWGKGYELAARPVRRIPIN